MTSKRDSRCFVLALALDMHPRRQGYRSVIDLPVLQNSIRIEIFSSIARFSVR